MSYSVTLESFSSLESLWRSGGGLRWDCLFVLPAWLEVWWQHFRTDAALYLGAVRDEGRVIGIAPLQLRGQTAAFVGNTDVCDYEDFVVVPGREGDFFSALLADLAPRGIKHLDLKHVRPDSLVFTRFADWLRQGGHKIDCQAEAVSAELELPSTWDAYLGLLTTKQRHEVGRKLRRLGEMGSISYRTVQDEAGAAQAMDVFVKLFSDSRGDKAAFMTPPMEAYFRAIASAMSRAGRLRLGVLELDGLAMAMVMGFELQGTLYLYNSGFDPQYRYLSAGLLSKVLCIKDSIETGIRRFDFLKGPETYKGHLGGRETRLYSCQVDLS